MAKQDSYTISFFDGNIPIDFFLAFVGDKLGDGIAREVFIVKQDPSLVAKIELGNKEFQNYAEYQIWQAAPAWARKWLAPVRYISPYGHVLIQERCYPLLDNSKLPKRVPDFLADLHPNNWGLLKGKPVVLDYGSHNLFKNGLAKERLVPIKKYWKS